MQNYFVTKWNNAALLLTLFILFFYFTDQIPFKISSKHHFLKNVALTYSLSESLLCSEIHVQNKHILSFLFALRCSILTKSKAVYKKFVKPKFHHANQKIKIILPVDVSIVFQVFYNMFSLKYGFPQLLTHTTWKGVLWINIPRVM